jgi:microcin C transport system ATP-binding protein
LLSIQNLKVSFGVPGSGQIPKEVVHGVSFDLLPGQKLAVVGESGSGKTVSAQAILRLGQDAQYQGKILHGQEDLLSVSESRIRQVRGKEIAMIFQEPMSALNPLYSVGSQVCEVLELHEGLTRSQARAKGIELFAQTRIPEPERRFDSLPHQLSGGQRQRAMIAMALACSPKILIADEPTTALDVTVQKQIIALLDDLQRQVGLSVLLITHDLPLVRSFADHVVVMENGHLIEQGATQDLFERPQKSYTQKLIASRPQRLIPDSEASESSPTLMQGRGVGCRFFFKTGWFAKSAFDAVKEANIVVPAGRTLGIVGESGSGKTTLGLTLLRLARGQMIGEVEFEGRRIDSLSETELRPYRKNLQVVFQDPYNSLSPRMTVEQIVGEGLSIHQPDMKLTERRQEIVRVLQEVGLEAEALNRYPHEFSGGQRQRISIARAIIVKPKLILLDEPTSALDVSVQTQVLALLRNLQVKYGLSYLFITHDLAVIKAMSHEMIVMKGGEIVEQGNTLGIFEQPKNSYTQELLSASLN